MNAFAFPVVPNPNLRASPTNDAAALLPPHVPHVPPPAPSSPSFSVGPTQDESEIVGGAHPFSDPRVSDKFDAKEFNFT
jgi:hypothetical protein